MKRMRFTKLLAVAGLLCLAGSHEAKAQVLTDFVTHGVPAAVSESRGILAVRDNTGKPFIVAIVHDQYGSGSRCSLLVIDAMNGATQQYWFPTQNQANGDVYSVMRTLDGKIYTAFDKTFVEFDLNLRQFTFSGLTDGQPQAFTRTPDGCIYFANYSTSSLYRFNPTTDTLQNLGVLDATQQYPTYLEAGPDGWVYAGLGTTRGNIKAYNPATGEFKQLVDEAGRITGTSYVFIGTSGQVYGREYTPNSGRLMTLTGGVATFVAGNPANPQRGVSGAINWGNMLSGFPSPGGAILQCNIPEKYADVLFNGVTTRINFTYTSNGSGVTSLVTGPNGKVFGSSNHPMHFFGLTPATPASSSTITDYGPIPAVASGNFGAFGISDQKLIGDTYSNGELYEYDTQAAWNVPVSGATVNPHKVGTYADVSRPRAAVDLPNGNILFGGYPGYGVTGGGLVTYSGAFGTATVKSAAQLLPGHSTTALALLNSSTVVGGTSIKTPGGGVETATEAKLYYYDISTKTITYSTVPVPGVKAINDLYITTSGKVYGLTDAAIFFVFDTATNTVVHTANWSAWGIAFNPGHSMWTAPNGRVGVILPQYILDVDSSYTVRKLADLPATATARGSLLNNRLYFATGSQLRSVGLAPLGGGSP